MAWGQTFRPNLFDLDRHGWEIVLVSAIGLMFYLIGLESRVDATTSPSTNGLAPWTKQAIIVGLVAMCVGALPVWFVGRYVELDNTYSRHSLTTMFGACIFVVGLVQMIIRTRLQQIAVLSIAVALAVGFH
jgi:hypothetical protein